MHLKKRARAAQSATGSIGNGRTLIDDRNHNVSLAAKQRTACAFYRQAESPLRGNYGLCIFSGARKPFYGHPDGCYYLAGKWEEIDTILSLSKSRLWGNTELPNYVKPVTAYFHKEGNVANIHALDDFSEYPISHISEKLKRQFVRPECREVPVAHIARERTGCLFSRLNPNYVRPQ